MKLIDKINQNPPGTPFFTLEFFPPRTDQGFTNLLARISRLSALHPLATSITWGAGGSTRERSLELSRLSQDRFGLDTLMHLTCTNMELGTVDEVLQEAKENGIQSILALRGDPPRGQEEWIPVDPRFQHAIDLVKHIRSSPQFSEQFCIGVAGYPDGHPDGSPEEEQLKYLKLKIEAGADFIVTQLFYDVDGFKRWVRKLRAYGIHVPVIPGVMPLQSYTSFLRMTKLCGTKVPIEVAKAVEPIRNDDQQVKDYGVKLATKMVKQITEDRELGVHGVHFCTLNLEKSIRRILDDLGWSTESHRRKNLIIDETPATHTLPDEVGISAVAASISAVTALSHPPSLSLPDEHQIESTNVEVAGVSSTWDEFPNGRFGDPTSPAYGVGSGDQWDPGAGGLGVSRADAVSQWGSPKSIVDLNDVFKRHLDGDPRTQATPFSPDPLLEESKTILPHLKQMVERGWWTVGSQPAVDCASSTDGVFGWGPAGGYIFQKAFVEFFCEEETVRALERKVKESGGWATWFAANAHDDLITNLTEDDRNAVTWGVFPGQEIAQSTIIEQASFLAWKEEAFSIWSQWALLYPPNSEERALLESVREKRWLVSIVHHDFKAEDALWRLILE